jgi:hypothetical protein
VGLFLSQKTHGCFFALTFHPVAFTSFVCSMRRPAAYFSLIKTRRAEDVALCYPALSDGLSMKLRSRLGLKLVIAYLAIFLFAELIAFRALIFDTANSALSGVFAMFVTLPWSIILGPFWDWVGLVKWYGRFASMPAVYGFFASLTILPGAIANAAILYYIGRMIDHSARKPPSRQRGGGNSGPGSDSIHA